MDWTVALNRGILVTFLIGDTHTLERALRAPRPFLSWCRCRGMFLCNYPGKGSHPPFQFLIHRDRAFNHQMLDLDFNRSKSSSSLKTFSKRACHPHTRDQKEPPLGVLKMAVHRAWSRQIMNRNGPSGSPWSTPVSIWGTGRFFLLELSPARMCFHTSPWLLQACIWRGNPIG